MSSKYGRTEKGDTIGYGFVRKVTIFGDAPPSTRKEQFVGQAGELVGIGLFDPPQIFVTNGRTALEFHGRREHQYDIARFQRQAFVMLGVTANSAFGKVTAFRKTRGQGLFGQGRDRRRVRLGQFGLGRRSSRPRLVLGAIIIVVVVFFVIGRSRRRHS